MFENFFQLYCAAFFAVAFTYYSLKRFWLNLPPGPIGLPLVGMLPFLGQSPGKTFAKWSETYGPVISFKIGRKLWVVLNDYDSVYQSDLSNAVANILCGAVMGRRFDYKDPKFEEINAKTQKAFSEPGCNSAFIVLLLAPELGFIPPYSRHAQRLVDHVSACLEMLRDIIREHEQTFDKHNIRDFVDAFLSKQKKKEDSTYTDFQLVQYIRDLFVAGIETTTSTLRWGILCLIHFPHIQKRLRNEIFKVLGNSRQVRMEDKDNMPYACAFIQELYRYRTVVPMDVPHKTMADVEFKGYTIPKDTIVIPHLWAIHNDPVRWPEPEKFLPERHLNENRKFVSSLHIIPFSLGARHCLGERIARMEIFIFLVSLVQKFEIMKDPNDQELPDINTGVTGLGFIPHSFKMVAKQL